MSSNTNTLFWVICGAVIVTTLFLFVNNNDSVLMEKVFSKMNGYFQSAVNNENSNPDNNADNNNQEVENPNNEEEQPDPIEEVPLEEKYSQYIPSNWTLLDIAESKGMLYLSGNFKSIGSGCYQWDFKMINTNNYDIHLSNPKITFYDSQTNDVILTLNPYEWDIKANSLMNSFVSTPKPIGNIDHYVVFTWGN
ncbi:MAG TPA: hypothetical protein PLT65_00735 [Bacilli bacterium]|nr:hypothetical protein [Bacilli bacterium]